MHDGQCILVLHNHCTRSISHQHQCKWHCNFVECFLFFMNKLNTQCPLSTQNECPWFIYQPPSHCLANRGSFFPSPPSDSCGSLVGSAAPLLLLTRSVGSIPKQGQFPLGLDITSLVVILLHFDVEEIFIGCNVWTLTSASNPEAVLVYIYLSLEGPLSRVGRG